MYHKIFDIAHCMTCKMSLLDVEYVSLVRYCYQTAISGALYEPAGQPTDNLPNRDRQGEFHQSGSELTVHVNN